jgi:hypothetical protein
MGRLSAKRKAEVDIDEDGVGGSDLAFCGSVDATKTRQIMQRRSA